MFGYVLPVKETLTETHKERYKSLYCGVCHMLGQEYGQFSRFLLSYDFTFLALLLAQKDARAAQTCRVLCPARPWKKACACPFDESLRQVAGMCVILAYRKLQDDIADDGFFLSLPNRFLALVFRRAYGKARARFAAFDRLTGDELARLSAMEQAGETSLDKTADAFALILKSAAALIEDGPRRRVVEQMLYHTGRWIYILDAWDDRKQDARLRRYNAVTARFGKRPDEVYIKTTLLHSRNLAYGAFLLSDFGEDAPIIENILLDGMALVERMVLTGTWNTRRFARERPI